MKNQTFSIWKSKKSMPLKIVVYFITIIFLNVFLSYIIGDVLHNYCITYKHFVVWPGYHVDIENFLFFCAFGLFVSVNFISWRVLFHRTIGEAVGLSLLIGIVNAALFLMSGVK